LTALVAEGYGAYVLFVIQMDKVRYLHPNDATDPAFGAALRAAAQQGVNVMAVQCSVTEDSMVIDRAVEVRL
jgi:sugar fermentation stimulation protein A